jgi:hypothetical protein
LTAGYSDTGIVTRPRLIAPFQSALVFVFTFSIRISEGGRKGRSESHGSKHSDKNSEAGEDDRKQEKDDKKIFFVKDDVSHGIHRG